MLALQSCDDKSFANCLTGGCNPFLDNTQGQTVIEMAQEPILKGPRGELIRNLLKEAMTAWYDKLSEEQIEKQNIPCKQYYTNFFVGHIKAGPEEAKNQVIIEGSPSLSKHSSDNVMKEV